MGTSDISWSLHPANSRVLGALVNLEVGILWGVALALAISIGYSMGVIAFDGFSAGLLGVLLLFLVFIGRGGFVYFEAMQASGTRTNTFDEEFREAFRWPWIVLVTVIVAAAISALRFGYFPRWYTTPEWLLYWGGFSLSMSLLWFTQLASADGTIDPGERTLTYSRHAFKTREIELDNLSTVNTISLGAFTVVRFTFFPGTTSSVTPRYVVMPTETAEKAGQVFEQAVAHGPADEPNPKVRRQLFIGAALLMVFGGALFGMIYWGTGFLWFSALLAAAFGFPALIVIFVAFRS